ncbi:MAG: hypothetical protein ACI4JN_12775 [Ruminococcus sp.]
MKRIICILVVFIMLISVTACGNKTVSETNDVQSFSEMQHTETQTTEEELNETSMINTEDTSASEMENESTTLTSDESGNFYSPAASGCYPYNNGMDSPEEVIEAYLDAVISFDSDALYALFNLDEVTLTYEMFESGGVPTNTISSPYFMQTGIYYEMMMDNIIDDDWLILLQNPTKSYFYAGENTDIRDYYESWLEENNLDKISVDKVYLYDSVGLRDAEQDEFYEFIDDDINVICIDGKYYLSSVEIVLEGLDDTGWLLYADEISDAYEMEKMNFEENAYSPANVYPANAGMDSPEDVINAYLNASKSNNPESVYTLFNTSECKWAAEVYDKMFIEEFGMNFPIKLTKTDCMILTAKSDTLEYYEQTNSIGFEEIKDEDNFFENAVEYYSVPMPFAPQEVKKYKIETDSMTSYLYIYSVNDKWYLSSMGVL